MKATTKKTLISVGAGFSVMLGTAIAAYAIPIPFLRDAINEHLFALIVWSAVTGLGLKVSAVVRRKLG